MMHRSASYTVTREQYYRGKRSLSFNKPEATVRAPRRADPRRALEDAPYPRVDPEAAIEQALAALAMTTPP